MEQQQATKRRRYTISREVRVCPCHREQVGQQLVRDSYGDWRYLHTCPVDGFSLGFDGGVPGVVIEEVAA